MQSTPHNSGSLSDPGGETPSDGASVDGGGLTTIPAHVTLPGPAAVETSSLQPVDPYALVRRALRGRYLQFIVFVVLGAALGVAAGWKLGRPLYRGQGLIRIAYTVPSIGPDPTDLSSPLLQYEAVMRSQQQVLTSSPIVQKAVQDADWRPLGRGDSRDDLAEFQSQLSAQWLSGTQHLRVSFDDRDPVAAAAGAKAVIYAYVNAYRAGEVKFNEQRTQALEKHIRQLEERVAAADAQARAVAQEFGLSDIEMLVEMASATAKMLDSKGVDLTIALAVASEKAAQAGAERGAQAAPASQPADADPVGTGADAFKSMTVEDIAAQSERMRGLLAEEASLRKELEQFTLARGLGENHPSVVNAKRMLGMVTARVEQFAEQFRQTQALRTRYPDTIRDNPAAVAGRSVTAIRADAKLLAELREKASKELAAVVAKRQELEPVKADAKEMRVQIARLKSWRDALDMAANSTARVEVVEAGDVPLKPYYDIRKKYAAAGAMGGGAIPAVLVVLFALRNRRFRYSDEAETQLGGSAPLLGILPSLPSRLMDSEQAASASQCLHQIRVLLQVGAGGPGRGAAQRRRGVYLVTSATPGEGKTSLAVSLGLSFAAAGSRTVVIDCDIIGQRVTRGFNLRGVPGLRDALGAGSVRGFARKAACGMWVVPVGTADALDACAVSWGEMKRLLADARRYFDTIIIDSGPILGSVEATTVAPQCDGVIFTVSRGQHPSLVEKALRHLESIGAPVAGFVFNRAGAKDFSRSAHASSLRSIPAEGIPTVSLISDSETTGRFGPLVQAVVSLLPGSRSLVEPAGGAAGAVTSATASVQPTVEEEVS